MLKRFFNRKTRKELAERLRASRRRDACEFNKGIVEGWLVNESSLGKIQQDLKFDLNNITKAASERLKGKRKVRILDLGCLQGTAIKDIAGSFQNVEAHGISLARSPLWERSKNVFWHVGHAENTKLPSNYFDFVYSYYGITHVGNFEKTFKELRRILNSGGEAIFNIQPATALPTGNIAIKRFIEKNSLKIIHMALDAERIGFLFHVKKK